MKFIISKIHKSIIRRLIVYVLGAVMLMNVFMLVLIGARSSRQAGTYANDFSVSLSEGVASNIKVYLEQALETTNTLANTLMALRYADGVTREAIEMIFINILTGDDHYIAVWTAWEPNSYDGKDEFYMDDPLYEESHGRFSLSYYLDKGSVAINWSTLNDFSQPFYTLPKERGTKTIINPYMRDYNQTGQNNIYVTSVVTPIIVDGKFQGVVGIDIDMKNIYRIIQNVHLFESGTAAVLSSNLSVASHHDPTLIGKSIAEIVEGEHGKRVESALKNNLLYTYSNKTGGGVFRTFLPVRFESVPESWAVMTEVPLYEINAASRNLRNLILFIGLVGLVVISVVVYLMARNIADPILKINNIVEDAAFGRINAKIGFEGREDEVGKIALGMNKLLSGLRSTAEFARKIGQGNYGETHALLSDDDELGQALLQMQKSLQASRDEDLKRKAEDDIRNWITQGQAKFADITRQNTDDINELSYLIISNLVKYMKINQGGIFLINDEIAGDRFLELTACYAFDRRKYLEKKVEIGVGLVGTCFLEGKPVYMEKIPDNYMRITSGLGDQNPRSLLILPLKLNDQIFGVIELAAFKPFQKHEIEFTEKIGEIIASAISNLKTTYNTRILLEKSQQQAEEMRAQEEEMRQNMEELSATQEAMAEKDRENQDKIRELTAIIEQFKSATNQALG